MKVGDRVRELRRVAAHSLTPHPKNWRTHPKAQRDALQGVLAEIGYADALLARELDDGSLQLIDGHLRAETTPEMEVPVLVLDVSEAEAEKLLLTLDPLAALAGANTEHLQALLGNVSTSNEALAAMLQKLARDSGLPVAGLPVTEDEAPDPLKKAVTQAGDLWLLGDHRLLCGDSTSHDAVYRALDSDAPDLLFCDPPYGVAYQTKLSVEEAVARRRRTDGLEVANDDLGGEGTRELVRDALNLAREHLRGGAAFYVCAPAGCSEDGDMGLAFRQALADAGLRLRQAIVWVKDVFVMGRQDYHWRHEDILYGWKEGAGHFFVNDRTQDTVWEIPRPKRSESHPTMKPVQLVARAVANSSKPGEVVYEPFSGSGTTLAACEQLQRRCRAIELEPLYVDVAIRRWQTLTGRDAALEDTGQTWREVANARGITIPKGA